MYRKCKPDSNSDCLHHIISNKNFFRNIPEKYLSKKSSYEKHFCVNPSWKFENKKHYDISIENKYFIELKKGQEGATTYFNTSTIFDLYLNNCEDSRKNIIFMLITYTNSKNFIKTGTRKIEKIMIFNKETIVNYITNIVFKNHKGFTKKQIIKFKQQEQLYQDPKFKVLTYKELTNIADFTIDY